MKIALVSLTRDISLPSIDADGGANIPRSYALELGKRGHRVDFYTGRFTVPGSQKAHFDLRKKAQKKDKLILSKNVTVYRKDIKPIPHNSFTQKFEGSDVDYARRSFALARSLKSDMRKYDAIVLFHFFTAVGFYGTAGLPHEKALVMPLLLSDEYKKFAHVSKSYIDEEQNILERARNIITLSQSEKNSLIDRKINSDKVHILHQGFDHTIHTHSNKKLSGSMSRPVQLLCVGGIRPQKRQHLFPEIVQLLQTQQLDVRVTLIGGFHHTSKTGKTSYKEILNQEIKKKNVAPFMHLTGSLTPQQISEMFKDADIAVFPSISESFGMAALEAITSGIPTVICKKVPAYREFAKDRYNCLMAGESANDFAKAIARLIKTPRLYATLSKNGKKLRKEFNWVAATDKLESFLRRI